MGYKCKCWVGLLERLVNESSATGEARPAAWSLGGWSASGCPGPQGGLEDENYTLAKTTERCQVSGSPVAMQLPFQPMVIYSRLKKKIGFFLTDFCEYELYLLCLPVCCIY